MKYEEWLKARKNGIGGSDAAAILGLSPYKTNVELWEEKVGLRDPEDISDEDYVKYGKEAESHLVALFALDYPEYKVWTDSDYQMILHPEYPFLFATLDGHLMERRTGRKGILEIKTSLILNGSQREKWKDCIPDQYFCQVLHYLLVTGREFVEVKACLRWDYGDGVKKEIRHYHIERKDVQDSIDYLLQKEIEFWNMVQAKQRPNLILPAI